MLERGKGEIHSCLMLRNNEALCCITVSSHLDILYLTEKCYLTQEGNPITLGSCWNWPYSLGSSPKGSNKATESHPQTSQAAKKTLRPEDQLFGSRRQLSCEDEVRPEFLAKGTNKGSLRPLTACRLCHALQVSQLLWAVTMLEWALAMKPSLNPFLLQVTPHLYSCK